MTDQRKTITVVQGDYAVSGDPTVTLSTVLGSCIAVCLFDRQRQVGGMNHFLLATASDLASDDLKYGVNAMELLINKLLRLGVERHRLEAKLFGGARMTDHSRDIGASNARFAQDFLSKEGIPCLSSSLGGTKARRVQFIPTTGYARQLQIAGPPPAPELPKRTPRPQQEITLF